MSISSSSYHCHWQYLYGISKYSHIRIAVLCMICHSNRSKGGIIHHTSNMSEMNIFVEELYKSVNDVCAGIC